LGDFGLARIYDARSQEPLSHQVATRQYRAPELLFASRSYTPAVDVWSAAVVMAELATLQVPVERCASLNKMCLIPACLLHPWYPSRSHCSPATTTSIRCTACSRSWALPRQTSGRFVQFHYHASIVY
jgi:serine/threonine protein kinase